MGQVGPASATITHAVRAKNTAIASFARATEPNTRHQPQDGREVAEANNSRRSRDRAERAEIHCGDRLAAPVRRTTAEPRQHLLQAHTLRHELQSLRKRASPDEAQPFLDQRPGGADDADDQEPAPAKAGDATIRPLHYETRAELRTHLADFMAPCNFARRLKTLGGLTPYEYICKVWTSVPDRFILNPIHQMPGLNT